jgi:hypothetical protein
MYLGGTAAAVLAADLAMVDSSVSYVVLVNEHATRSMAAALKTLVVAANDNTNDVSYAKANDLDYYYYYYYSFVVSH